jgi:hypothetical protein
VKTKSLLAAAPLLLAVAACNQLERVADGDVDTGQRAAAQRIATKIYEACRDNKIEPLSEAEAIREMRESMTVDKQRQSCEAIKKQFGDYQSMDYAETWHARGTSLNVYRFKGHFSKGGDEPEIRVVMEGDKLSGFWLKPWASRPR